MRSKQDWNALNPWLNRLGKQPGALALGLVLMLLTFVAAVGLLGVSGWFITATAVTVGALNIYIPGGAIRFFALLRTVSRYIERIVNHNFILRVQALWRLQLFSGLAHQPPLATRRYSTAQVLQRLTQDLDALDALYIRVLAPFFVAFVASCLLSALIAIWLPLTAVVIFALLLLCLLLLAFPLAGRLKDLANDELAISEQLRTRALDHVNGQAEMLCWQVQAQHAARVTASASALSNTQARLQRRQNIVQAVVDGMIQLLVVIAAIAALTAAQQGAISTPVAVLLPLALLALSESYLPLPQASALWGRVVGAASRLNQQVQNAAPEQIAAGAENAKAPVRVTLCNVSIHYQQRQIWDNLSLELQPGEVCVLTGPSGQGKSTLAYLISGLAKASAGQVEIDGTAIPAAWHTSVAYLTQETSLLTGSIEQNLRLANREADHETLWQALQSVELAERVQAMEGQLQQWIGDGGTLLSGGEGRRLALARVLLKNSGLVILDEPFRGVGPEQAQRIWTNMEPWLEGKTVLLIAHQSDFLPAGCRFLKVG